MNTNDNPQKTERQLTITLTPITGSEDAFRLHFSSENIESGDKALIAVLQELVEQGRNSKLYPTSYEPPLALDRMTMDFTFTDKERVDVWVDNLPTDLALINGLLSDILANLIASQKP